METMRLGRNDLCQCGSGKKYKKCCLPSQPLEAPIPTYRVRRVASPSRPVITPQTQTPSPESDGIPEYVFVKNKGWTHRNELRPGDECKFKDGDWAIYRPDLMNGGSAYVKDKGWIPESELKPGDQYQIDGVWVTFQPERTIGTTEEHPFFVKDKGWTPARELKEGDLLRTADGWVPVTGVKATGRWEPVYNLRVADYHTYFVGSPEWGFAVWAHNAYRVVQSGGQVVIEQFDPATNTVLRTIRSGDVHGIQWATPEGATLYANEWGATQTQLGLGHAAPPVKATPSSLAPDPLRANSPTVAPHTNAPKPNIVSDIATDTQNVVNDIYGGTVAGRNPHTFITTA